MRRRILPIIAICLGTALLLGTIFVWRQAGKAANMAPKSPIFAQDLTQSLVQELAGAGLSPDSAPAILGDSITASISGYTAIFSKGEDLKNQVRALQLVLPRLKMDSKKVTVIDLRFNKVVIR